MQLKSHEGLANQKDLALLFAASGDLRNVVKTVADLPSQFKKSISLTINDRDSAVVARNLILLLLALDTADQHSPETDQDREVAKTLIHIWYSSFINSTAQSQIQVKVLPLISGVCDEALLLEPGAFLGKTWYFTSQKSLQVTLKREEWLLARRLCCVPGSLTFEKAQEIRTAVTLAPERADYRDRWRYKELTPALRVGQDRFRKDGILLPFGHTRNGFDIPNPTLFHDQRAWPLDDKADPLTGWPIWEVRNEKSHTVSDIYGKLFVYLQKVIGKFLERLATLTVHFEMCSTDIRDLALRLPKDHFARIEISNISDAGYVGIHDTLAILAPLLQPHHLNSHSTLITLFLNAVMERVKASGEKDSTGNINLLMEYLPRPDVLTLLRPDNADMTRLWDARTLSFDVESHFEAYMVIHKFAEIGMAQGVYMKSPNTIIEEWPTQLKHQHFKDPGRGNKIHALDLELLNGGPVLEYNIDPSPDVRTRNLQPDRWQPDVEDRIDAKESASIVTLINRIAAESQARFLKPYPTKSFQKSIRSIHATDHRNQNPTARPILISVPHSLQIVLLLLPTPMDGLRKIIFDKVQ
ncbi:hypothetical protein N7526_011456 [Penicillium atrosanguineum]|nr:hypothetical protein N7526_011456 [Penicillium atrosanguineum]